MLPTSREASAARAATSKRAYNDPNDPPLLSGGAFVRHLIRDRALDPRADTCIGLQAIRSDLPSSNPESIGRRSAPLKRVVEPKQTQTRKRFVPHFRLDKPQVAGVRLAAVGGREGPKDVPRFPGYTLHTIPGSFAL